MVWPILLITQLLILGAFLFWQLYTISKRENLDNVLYNLRELHARAIMMLADNLLDNEATTQEENLELKNFIDLTGTTVYNFDKIEKEYLTVNSYRRVFVNIDSSFKNIEDLKLEYNQKTYELRRRFVHNLRLAFHSIPFFKFRIIAVIVVCIVRILAMLVGLFAWIGLKSVTLKIEKYKHIVQTYCSLGNDNDHNNYGCFI